MSARAHAPGDALARRPAPPSLRQGAKVGGASAPGRRPEKKKPAGRKAAGLVGAGLGLRAGFPAPPRFGAGAPGSCSPCRLLLPAPLGLCSGSSGPSPARARWGPGGGEAQTLSRRPPGVPSSPVVSASSVFPTTKPRGPRTGTAPTRPRPDFGPATRPPVLIASSGGGGWGEAWDPWRCGARRVQPRGAAAPRRPARAESPAVALLWCLWRRGAGRASGGRKGGVPALGRARPQKCPRQLPGGRGSVQQAPVQARGAVLDHVPSLLVEWC